MNFIKQSFFISLILTVVVVACKKNNEELNESDLNIPPNEDYQLKPSQAEWSNRVYPDTFIVNILNGKPPYSITKSFSFAANSTIQNETIIITPNVLHSDTAGNDKIIIQDSLGKQASFNLTVNTHRYHYNQIMKYDVKLKGDTSFYMDTLSTLEYATFDDYDSIFIIEAKYRAQNKNQLFRLWINEVSKADNYFPYRLYFKPNQNSFPNDFTFVPPIDTSQSISINKISLTEVHISISNFKLKSQYGNYTGGDVFLDGEIQLKRKN